MAVIGGGDSAIGEAASLKFSGDSQVIKVLGEDRVTGLRLQNVKAAEESTLPLTGMFVAIGHDARCALFARQLPTNADGYLPVDRPPTCTAIDGVSAAGDVVDRTYRQAVKADQAVDPPEVGQQAYMGRGRTTATEIEDRRYGPAAAFPARCLTAPRPCIPMEW